MHTDQAERTRANQLLTEACKAEGVWPYFVPLGGFMVTPVMDISADQMSDAASLTTLSYRTLPTENLLEDTDGLRLPPPQAKF